MAGVIQLSGKYAKLAEKMLREVTEILESHKIPYVLEGGTLLGIVREGRLLPWDNDMDLTITREHANRLISIRWKFWLKGYRTRLRRYKKDIGPFKKGSPRILKIQTTKFLFFKDTSLMDIFIKELIDDKYFWAVAVNNPVLKAVPRYFYENVIQYSFQGKSYSIPADYTNYLKARYGNWETPQKEYDFRTDDRSIEKFN